MDGIAGVIAMETNCAGATVRVVEPAIEPELAKIVVCPRSTLLARPDAEIIATVLWEDDQVTAELKSWVLPSL